MQTGELTPTTRSEGEGLTSDEERRDGEGAGEDESRDHYVYKIG